MAQKKGIQGRRWTFDNGEYFERDRRLLVEGQPVRVESKPLDVLQILLERPAEILTKDQLIGEAWDVATSDQSLAVAISKLRRAFGGARDRILLSVPGVGYRMAVPVHCREDTTPPPPAFVLDPGDTLPFRDHWIAVRPLDLLSPHYVWFAEHQKTHAARVFKFAMDGVRLRALQREVALSRLLSQAYPHHPHFVQIADWNFEQAPFFTEAPFGGTTLFEFAETPEFGAMSNERRARLVAEMASAIADAHTIGVLHNDLKPSNILVYARNVVSTPYSSQHDADPWQARVVDFGIASLADPGQLRQLDITDHGEFLEGAGHGSSRSPRGTSLYSAPELRRNGSRPDTRADIYALGVILFQVICGDFSATLSPGWEKHVPDPLLRQDIADACHLNLELRTASASILAHNLTRLPERRAEADLQHQEEQKRLRNEQALLRARARQPWIAATMAALVLGILGTAWFFYRATQDRNQALSRGQTLDAMNRFLTDDLLVQANPLYSVHKGPTEQKTLLEAIQHAQPLIDSRFSSAPETAAAIHKTLGNAFGALTSYDEAHREYKAAALRYRQAQGPFSQDALQVELRDTNFLYMELTPQGLAKAQAAWAALQPALVRVKQPAPELQGWRALVASSDILTSNAPAESALPLLEAAISQARQVPGYSASLLEAMELRLCGVYLKANRGQDAARTALAAIETITRREGPDSPLLIQPENFLEEAYFVEGDYSKAEVQSGSDYEHFLRVLGPESKFTMNALDMHAQAEGALNHYPQAIQDWLKLYQSATGKPSADFFSQTAIVEAGQLECHSGAYTKGEQHLRQGLEEINAHSSTKALNYSVGSLALAECMLGQVEDGQVRSRQTVLADIQHSINNFDLPIVQSFPGTDSAQGILLLTKARLAFQQHQFAQARQGAQQAAPLVNTPATDDWERGRLTRLDNELHKDGF